MRTLRAAVTWLLVTGASAALAAAPANPAAPQTPAAPAKPAAISCDIRHIADCFDASLQSINDAVFALLGKLPLLALALVVILLANWVSRFVSNRLHLLKIRSDNPYMSNLVRTVVRTAILLVGVLTALDLVGMRSAVGAVLGSAGVAGLVLGFAFREIAENYIAGILLSVRRPFEPGDHVVIENREGKVMSVNSRATVLMTMDGSQLQLPNSLVFKSVVLNYSRNPKRRFDFAMFIDDRQSIRKSQALALETIAGIEGVLDDPAPAWTVVEYGAAGIQLRFFAWVDQRSTDMGKVRSEAIRQVKGAFARAGIEAPRTVYHIATLRGREDERTPEPTHNGAVDTSVNREIDAQIAEVQQSDSNRNLLNTAPTHAPTNAPPADR